MEQKINNNNSTNLQNRSEIRILLNQILPIYMQVELKNNKKPVMIGTNFQFQKINQIINKRFPNAAQDLITQEKLDKIYEGIVDIIRGEKETAMIFKNVIDVEIVKMYFYPYDLKEACLFQNVNQINLVILIFNQK
ncbi:hypothetical protein ABPG74_003664 [Tetrahymena malaccensis]